MAVCKMITRRLISGVFLNRNGRWLLAPPLKPLSSLFYRWDVLKNAKISSSHFSLTVKKINLFPHEMRKHKSVIIKQKLKAAWLKNH